MKGVQEQLSPQTYTRTTYLLPGEFVVANRVRLYRDVPLHVHEFYEIAFILEGTAFHVYGAALESIGAGDVLLINPAIPHGYRFVAQAPLCVANAIFTEAALEGALGAPEVGEALGLFFAPGRTDGGVPRLSITAPVQQGASDLLHLTAAMVREYEGKRAGYQSILRGYLLVVLTELWRRYKAVTRGPSGGDSWQRLLPALHRLYRTAGVGLGVGDLAQASGWSVTHFTRLFKQATGHTAQHFIRRLRAHRAATLLLTTPRSLARVAQDVGYADVSSFRRAFRACFGTSPAAYRRRAGEVRA